MRLNRRETLMSLASTALAVGAAGVVGFSRWDRGSSERITTGLSGQVRDFSVAGTAGGDWVDMAIAKSSKEPRVLVERAVAALGGMARFISRGDIVAIKPNIGWDRTPYQAANTNPEVVAALVRLVLDAGASQVVVTDASCNDARRSFQRSGIWRAAHDEGAAVILPSEHRFRSMRLRGELLTDWPVYKPLVEADKIINVPVAKHHNLCRYTGAMKNWYGLLGGRRNRLHQNIDLSIADLATFIRPTLTVIDATRVLMRNGPQGGNIDDTRELFQVIASVDQVAADAYACTLIGERPNNIGYLRLGLERGLGTTNLAALRVSET
jgi:uncharacterized protein (DUF362 family)